MHAIIVFTPLHFWRSLVMKLILVTMFALLSIVAQTTCSSLDAKPVAAVPQAQVTLRGHHSTICSAHPLRSIFRASTG
ncbi:hypothetical protein BD414DRAFT_494259 [Trametes punicea]|nr:hypothetical protein BD414DRAFT_494259 [Trametes punicea]